MHSTTESKPIRPKILIVEDDADMLAMLRLMITRGIDSELLVARDGIEAVVTATRERPDLIVMDLNLPLMDGFEATRQIRSQAVTSGIPVLAISNYFWHVDWRNQALDAGCRDCIDKGQLYSNLNTRISSLLAGNA